MGAVSKIDAEGYSSLFRMLFLDRLTVGRLVSTSPFLFMGLYLFHQVAYELGELPAFFDEL